MTGNSNSVDRYLNVSLIDEGQEFCEDGIYQARLRPVISEGLKNAVLERGSASRFDFPLLDHPTSGNDREGLDRSFSVGALGIGQSHLDSRHLLFV
jgi:hypothetical protein